MAIQDGFVFVIIANFHFIEESNRITYANALNKQSNNSQNKQNEKPKRKHICICHSALGFVICSSN